MITNEYDVLDVFGEPADKNAEAGWMYVEHGKSEEDNYHLLINFDKSEKVSQIRVQFP